MISQALQEEVQRLKNTPSQLLGAIDRQKKFLARAMSVQKPCWSCLHPVSALEAAGESFAFDDCADDFHCIHCGAVLRYTVLFWGGEQVWTAPLP